MVCRRRYLCLCRRCYQFRVREVGFIHKEQRQEIYILGRLLNLEKYTLPVTNLIYVGKFSNLKYKKNSTFNFVIEESVAVLFVNNAVIFKVECIS